MLMIIFKEIKTVFVNYFVLTWCQNLNNNCVWNVFSQVVAMSQNVRHNKFCLRLAMKVLHACTVYYLVMKVVTCELHVQTFTAIL